MPSASKWMKLVAPTNDLAASPASMAVDADSTLIPGANASSTLPTSSRWTIAAMADKDLKPFRASDRRSSSEKSAAGLPVKPAMVKQDLKQTSPKIPRCQRLPEQVLTEIRALEGTPAKRGVHGFCLLPPKPKAYVECFAGTARLSQALMRGILKKGIEDNRTVECYEVARSMEEDLLLEDRIGHDRA